MIFNKNTDKRILMLILAALFVILGVILYLFGDVGIQADTVLSEQNDLFKIETVITEADRNTDYENAEQIGLSETEGTVLIEKSGDYVLSGELDGNICIEAEEQNVHLYLNNVTVNSPKGPAIVIHSAGKVIITVMEGTENYLYDSGEYDLSKEEDACIYSACDITFNGGGSLEIYGYHKDAIHSKDRVKVIDSSMYMKAKREGMRGNDGIYIENARVDIECMNDGLRTKNSGDLGRGNIEILDSEISIIAGRYGINSESNYVISGSTDNIKGVVLNNNVKGDIYTIGEAIKDE